MKLKLTHASVLVALSLTSSFAFAAKDSPQRNTGQPAFNAASAPVSSPAPQAQQNDQMLNTTGYSAPAAGTRSPFLDTKQVVYPYDPNQSYPIVTRPGMYTQIDLPEGFYVEGFYLSDTDDTKWAQHVSQDKRHIFIQPKMGGLFNSGSIISGESSYLLAITSEDKGEWHQRVKWTMSKSQTARFQKATAPIQAAANTSAPASGSDFYENYKKEDVAVAAGYTKKSSPDVANINTNWRIEGDASFKPVSVYDDGKFTYIVLPVNFGEMPALFSIPEKGEPELINYIVEGENGNQFKVTRVLSGALLKLGKSEVKIFNNKSSSKKLFGFISSPFSTNSVQTDAKPLGK